MEVITIFPALVAIVVCLLNSPATAFLNVYMPALLLIPAHFRWRVPGLPDPSFQHAAILPIALMLPFMRRAAWRFSLTDVLVLSYAAVIGYSEYRAAGWWDAQNLMLDQLCTVLLPYVLAKILLQPEGNGARFAKRFTVMLAAVAVLSLWEFRMGRRLFFETLWGQFFPDEPQIQVQYRWGFGRIGGPYLHAILAGTIFGVALFLQAWLMREGRWKTRLTRLAVLLLVMMGSLLTMSRGPWLGILVGACVAILGFVRNRKGALLKLSVVALVAVPLAWQFFEEYTSVSSLDASSSEQQNAAYRAELLDVYFPRIMAAPMLGYGTKLWPAEQTYSSIDNAYLLLALQHGIPAVALLIVMLLWVCGRLAVYGARRPPRTEAVCLAFTLLGAIGSIAATIVTVFLGAQVEPVLFLLLGWSEGLLVYGYASTRRDKAEAAPQPLHAFQRVLS